MIQYIWEAAQGSLLLGERCIATDSEAVAQVAREFGGRVIMTSGLFQSGTDRVASVARNSSAPIVVNLQADEPLLTSQTIDRLIEVLQNEPEFGMATLIVPKHSASELADPNVVKVVVGESGEALYFSRQPLASEPDGRFFKHIGIYAYRREALLRLAELPTSRLERTERLEQLRALENGIRIKAIPVSEDSVAVDVPDDIEKVERRLRERSRLKETV